MTNQNEKQKLEIKHGLKVEFAPEHFPVMINEVLDAFDVFRDLKNPKYFDGTFGRGGHFRTVKELIPQMSAVVFDQDLQAIQFAKETFSTEVQNQRLQVIHANFAQFSEYNLGNFDMMLLDLGVSSPQLDQAERGFSFYQDGPLDMRMNQFEGVTAEFLVNTLSEQELIRLFKEFGEVYNPYRVVRAIVHDRKTKAFTRTSQLAGLIERVDGWRQKGHHPATKYFMGLRLAVNHELDVLSEALPKMMQQLNDGGRLAVISFHSLEDRIVKNLFRESTDLGFPVSKRVIIPTDLECEVNSRSRSAKLRIFQRGAQDELRKFKTPKAFS